MASMSGRACLITGGSSGIGLAIARRFAEDGASVCIASRSRERLDAAASSLGGVSSVAADVSTASGAAAAADYALERLGRIDVLVNAAGAAYFTPLHETTEELWDATIDGNLKSVFLMCKAVAPRMLEAGRGDIVNIASIAGHQGFDASTAYCASKHGVIGFSKALAMEVRRQGLRVITVTPGAVDTPLWDAAGADFDRSRMLTPGDVAEAVYGALTFSASAVQDEVLVMPADGVL